MGVSRVLRVSEAGGIVSRAESLRRKGLTPEQAERRRIVDERNKRLQEAPVRRGPAAHLDGTFGKVKT
jgi:hypothetical protein